MVSAGKTTKKYARCCYRGQIKRFRRIQQPTNLNFIISFCYLANSRWRHHITFLWQILSQLLYPDDTYNESHKIQSKVYVFMYIVSLVQSHYKAEIFRGSCQSMVSYRAVTAGSRPQHYFFCVLRPNGSSGTNGRLLHTHYTLSQDMKFFLSVHSSCQQLLGSKKVQANPPIQVQRYIFWLHGDHKKIKHQHSF